jgi:hypothetical protein
MAKYRPPRTNQMAAWTEADADYPTNVEYDKYPPNEVTDLDPAWRVALLLDPIDHDYRLILRAFEAQKLNPKHPHDWRKLVTFLAEAYFGEEGGAPIKWPETRVKTH